MSTPMSALWVDLKYLRNFRYGREIREDEAYPSFVLTHFRKRAAIADRFWKHLQFLLAREIIVRRSGVDVREVKNNMKFLESDFDFVRSHLRHLRRKGEKGEMGKEFYTTCLDGRLRECAEIIRWFTLDYFGELK